MAAAGMVGHNLQEFFLCFGTNHEIAIGPSISAANLFICFSGHINTFLSFGRIVVFQGIEEFGPLLFR
jgi:hypothetical protein